jgi:hypothetical protein
LNAAIYYYASDRNTQEEEEEEEEEEERRTGHETPDAETRSRPDVWHGTGGTAVSAGSLGPAV